MYSSTPTVFPPLQTVVSVLQIGVTSIPVLGIWKSVVAKFCPHWADYVLIVIELGALLPEQSL